MFSNSAPAMAAKLEQLEKEKKQRDHQMASLEQALARQKKETIDAQRLFDEMQRKNNELLEANNRHENSIKRLRDDYMQIDFKRQNIEQQLTQKDQKLKAENQENRRLQTQVDKMQQTIDKIESDKTKWDAEKFRLENRVKFLEGSNDSQTIEFTTHQNIAEIRELLKKEQDKVASLRRENEQLKSMSPVPNALLNDFQPPTVTSQQQHRAAQNSEHNVFDLERQITEMRNLLAGAEKENTSLISETSKLRKEICNLENEKLAAAKQHEKATRDISAKSEQALEDKAREIEKLTEALEKNRQEMLKRAATLNTEKSKLESDVERLSQENKEAASELKSLHLLLKEKDVDINTFSCDVTKLKNEIRQRDESLVEAIEIREMALLNLRSELDDTKNALAKAQAKSTNNLPPQSSTSALYIYEDKKLAAEEISTLLESLKQEIVDLRGIISSQDQELSGRLESIHQLENELRQLDAQQVNFEKIKNSLQEKIELISSERDSFKTHCYELNDKVAALEENLTANGNLVKRLEQELVKSKEQSAVEDEEKNRQQLQRIVDLETRLEDTLNLVNDKEQTIQQLQFNLELSADTISDLQEQVDGMSNSLKDASIKVAALENKCDDLEGEKLSLELLCSEAQQDFKNARKNVEKLESQLVQSSNIIDELNEQLCALNAQKAATSEDLVKWMNEIEDLRQKLLITDQQSQLNAAANENYLKEFRTVKDQLKDANDKNEQLEKKLTLAQEESRQLRTEISKIETEAKTMSKSLEKQIRSNEQQLVVLNENFSTCKDELDARIKVNKKLINDNDNLILQKTSHEQQIQNLKHSIAEYEHVVDQKESKVISLEDGTKSLQAQIDSLQQLRDESEKRICELLSMNENLRSEVTTMSESFKSREASLEEELEKVRHELFEIKALKDAITADLDSMKNLFVIKEAQSQHDSESLNGLNEELATVKLDLEVSRKEQITLKNSVDEYEKMLEIQKTLVDDKCEEIAKLESKVSDREDNVIELKQAVEALLTEKHRSRESFEFELQVHRDQANVIESERTEISKSLVRLQKKLEISELTVQNTVDALKNKDIQLETAKRTIEAKQDIVESLQAQLDEMASKGDVICDLSREMQKLRDKLAQMYALVEEKDLMICSNNDTLDAFQKRESEFLKEIEKLHSDQTAIIENSSAIRFERDEVVAKLESMEKVLEDLVEQKAFAETQVQESRKCLAQASDRQENLRQKLDQLEFERENERADLEVLVAEQESTAGKLDQLKIALDAATTANEDLENKYNAAVSKLESFEKLLHISENKESQALAQNKDLTSRLNNEIERNTDLQVLCDRVAKENDLEIGSLNVEIEKQQEKIVKLQTQLSTAEIQIAELQNSSHQELVVEQLQAKVEDYQISYAYLEDANQKLLVDIETWNQKCAAIESQLNKAKVEHDQNASELSKQVDVFENRCAMLEDDIRLLQTKLSQADQALDSKARLISNLQNDLSLAEDRVKTQNRAIDELQSVVREKQNAVEELQKKLIENSPAVDFDIKSESAETKICDNSNSEQKLREELEYLLANYDRLESDYQNLVAKRVELDTTIGGQRDALCSKQSECDNLTSQLESLQYALDNERELSERKQVSLNERYEEISAQLQTVQEEVSNMKKELNERDFEIKALNDEKMEMVEKLRKAEEIFINIMNEKEEARHCLLQKEELVDAQIAKLQRLEEKIIEMDKNHADDVEKLRFENDLVKSRNDELMTTLQSFQESNINDLLSNAEQKISLLESDLYQIAESQTDSRNQILSLKQENDRLGDENKALEVNLEKAKQDIDVASEKYHQNSEQMKLSLDELNAKLEVTVKAKQNSEVDLRQALDETKQLRDQIVLIRREKEEASVAKQNIETKVEELQKLLDEKEARQAHAEKDLQKTQTLLKQCREDIQDKDSKITELTSKVELQKAETSDAESAMREKADCLNTKIKRLEDQKKELITNANSLTKKCEMHETDKNELKILYEKRISTLEEQIKIMEGTKSKKTSTTGAIPDPDEVYLLRSQIKNLEERVKDHEDLEEMYLNVRNERDSFQRRYEKLRLRTKTTETTTDIAAEKGLATKVISKRSFSVMKDKDGVSSPLAKKKVSGEKENADDCGNDKTPTKLASTRRTSIYKAPAPSADEKVPECKQQ